MNYTPYHNIHYSLSGNTITQQQHPSAQAHPPKVIHYNHTVRMISGQSSSASDAASQLLQRELEEKKKEIDQLKQIVGEKDEIMARKNQQIQLLQGKLKKELVEQKRKSELKQNQGIDEFKRRLGISDLDVKLTESHLAENMQISKVKRQMESTMTVLQNITDQINKPKRKYQFYNNFERQGHISYAKEIKSKKKVKKAIVDSQINPLLSSTLKQNTQRTRIRQFQTSRARESDLSQTVEDQSSEEEFIESLLLSHEQLKQSLLQLQESSQREMEEIRNYYEGQIQMYVELLSKDKDEDEENNKLNSTRTNIEQDSDYTDERQGEQQQQNQEYFEWGKDHRFQIIFPSDEVFSPDIIE